MHSFFEPTEESNPFISLMLKFTADDECHPVTMSWRKLLLGKYDILHIHWPEQLLRSDSVVRRAAKRVVFAVGLLRNRIERKPIVRTVHNIVPHEQGSPGERFLLRLIDSSTDCVVIMNDAPELTEPLDRKPTVLIPHGDYRDWFENWRECRKYSDEGPWLYFGLIRPYKNVPSLVNSMRECHALHRRLEILGAPSSDRIQRELESISEGRNDIDLHLTHVSDSELSDALLGCSLVILPYTEMYNSGAALLALSFERPVLVPKTSANERLLEEFGGNFVRLYEGDISPEVLLDADRWLAHRDRNGTIAMEGRSWNKIGKSYRNLYSSLMHGVVR
jgi:beta-1,4-mannosyltransferase